MLLNLSISLPYLIIWYVVGIPLILLDGNKCGSVKQIRGTCKSLESPVKSRIFVTNPRISKSAKNGFFSGKNFLWISSFLFSDIRNIAKLNDLV